MLQYALKRGLCVLALLFANWNSKISLLVGKLVKTNDLQIILESSNIKLVTSSYQVKCILRPTRSQQGLAAKSRVLGLILRTHGRRTKQIPQPISELISTVLLVPISGLVHQNTPGIPAMFMSFSHQQTFIERLFHARLGLGGGCWVRSFLSLQCWYSWERSLSPHLPSASSPILRLAYGHLSCLISTLLLLLRCSNLIGLLSGSWGGWGFTRVDTIFILFLGCSFLRSLYVSVLRPASGSHVWVRAWKASWNLEEKREPRWVEKQWNQDMLVCSKFNFNVRGHVLIKKGWGAFPSNHPWSPAAGEQSTCRLPEQLGSR
jgi:hypothetical protein